MRLLFYSASSPSLSPSAPSEWSIGSPILQHGKEKLNLQHRLTLNHKRYGVYMFITPLLLLPLLASSYAEVNYEGVKVIQVFLFAISRLFTILFFPEYPPNWEEGAHVPIPLRPPHPDDRVWSRHILRHNRYSINVSIQKKMLQLSIGIKTNY